MKKIIFLLSLMSCQAMAYPNSISEKYPLTEKVAEASANDDVSVKDSFEYNKNLGDIYKKLSEKQKEDFLGYLTLYRDSTDKLLNISLDRHLLVSNDVVQNKITVNKVYLDYIFYSEYPKFVKSYFTIQSIIKYENPKLFALNVKNVKKVLGRKNKIDSYASHLEDLKSQILLLVKNDKKIEDVNDFITKSLPKEKDIFEKSLDEDKINVPYSYIKYGINKYNDEDTSLRNKMDYLEFLNDISRDSY